MASVAVHPIAFKKIALHAYKYPHKDVCGLLLGSIDGAKFLVKDVFPLFHTSVLAPLTDTAIMVCLKHYGALNQSIIGVYGANEYIAHNEPSTPITAIADKIRSQQKNAVILQIDNMKINPSNCSEMLKSYSNDGRGGGWLCKGPAVSSLSIGAPEGEDQSSEVAEWLAERLRSHQQYKLCDFDNHMDDLTNDPFNRWLLEE